MPSVAETLQNILMRRATEQRQAQEFAHQQELERAAREQSEREAEQQAQNIKVSEQNRIKDAILSSGRGASVDPSLANTEIGRMLTNPAAPAVNEQVIPETNPAKQQGIYPGIVANSGSSLGSAEAPGRISRGTPAEQKTAEEFTRQQAYIQTLPEGSRERRLLEYELQTNKNAPAGLFEPTNKVRPPTAEEDKAKAIDIGTRISMGQPVSDQEKAWANNYERVSTQGTRTSFNLNTPVRDTARSDRSYTALSSQLESGYKPVNDQLDRMGRLVISVNQETPQADALIAPELLTAMAGGMGSGLRMNESEIARIVGGRSAFENLKATIMHYNPDNNQALSVTPAQRQQIRALIAAMQEKLFAKQEAYTKARQDLAAADSVDEQRQVHNTLKESLGNIDNPPQKGTASSSGASAAPTNETPAARAKRLYDALVVK